MNAYDDYALLLWIIPQLHKFPRLRRYTLGERIETLLLPVTSKIRALISVNLSPFGDIFVAPGLLVYCRQGSTVLE